jgi:hypothetical protein
VSREIFQLLTLCSMLFLFIKYFVSLAGYLVCTLERPVTSCPLYLRDLSSANNALYLSRAQVPTVKIHDDDRASHGDSYATVLDVMISLSPQLRCSVPLHEAVRLASTLVNDFENVSCCIFRCLPFHGRE